MSDAEQAAEQLERELTLALDVLLQKPVFQVEFQDWLEGKRDDDYRLILASRIAKVAMTVFTRPH